MVAIPTPRPGTGNAIVPPPIPWHQLLLSGLLVGVSIWLIEQNVSEEYAMLLALIVLLGMAIWHKGFAAELEAIRTGKA